MCVACTGESNEGDNHQHGHFMSKIYVYTFLKDDFHGSYFLLQLNPDATEEKRGTLEAYPVIKCKNGSFGCFFFSNFNVLTPRHLFLLYFQMPHNYGTVAALKCLLPGGKSSPLDCNRGCVEEIIKKTEKVIPISYRRTTSH